mgnify:CR=1 FL=1
MLVISKKPGGRIRYACEKLIDGKRILVVRKDYEDGTVRDEMTLMPTSDRPLLFMPNLADDLDDVTVRDMVQSFYGRRAAKRVKKPDVTALYHEYNAMRAAAFKGQRHYAMGVNDGNAD